MYPGSRISTGTVISLHGAGPVTRVASTVKSLIPKEMGKRGVYEALNFVRGLVGRDDSL